MHRRSGETLLSGFAFYLGVCSLAISVPLVSFTIGNSQFIHMDRSGYTWFLIAYYLLPPVILVAGEQIAARVSTLAGCAFRLLVTAGAMTIILMQVASHYKVFAGPAGLVVVFGALVVVAWRGAAFLRPTFMVAGLLSPVIVGYFLYAVNFFESHRVSAADGQKTLTVTETGMRGSRPGPVIVMIFDGFALEAALDGKGDLLPRYGNLRRLAELGVWIRGATTNYDSSFKSIPSMLSGRFFEADDGERGVLGRHSLLERVAPYYVVELYGLDLGYCSGSSAAVELCYDEAFFYSRQPRMLLKAMFLSYLRLSLPGPVQAAWPWWRMNAKTMSTELADMLVESLAQHDADRRFYLLHISIPHEPYVLDGAGKQHFRNPILDTFTGALMRPEDVDVVLEYYRQEIDYVDAYIGRVLDRLAELNRLSDATVVVTSDHGVSWTWEQRGRDLGFINDQIARVPLFIKPRSGFSDGAAASSYEHIDLVPTMLHLLDMPAGSGLDGTSVFSSDYPVREKRAFSRGIPWRYDASGGTWIRAGQGPSAFTWPAVATGFAPRQAISYMWSATGASP